MSGFAFGMAIVDTTTGGRKLEQMATITLEVHGMRVFFPNTPCCDKEEWERAGAHIKQEIIRVLQDDRMKMTGLSRGQCCDLGEYGEIQFAPEYEDGPEEVEDDGHQRADGQIPG